MSITGPSATGKSLLLNGLINNSTGFKAKEKGLWIWGKPIELPNNVKLLVIKTEGLSNADIPRSQKVFLISVLISSCLIYNSLNDINEESLQQLMSVADISRKINLKNEEHNPNDDLIPFLPHFIWALRDYQNEINPDEYLIQALDKEGNKIIKKLFVNHQCYYFPKSNDSLTDSYESASPEFKSSVSQFITMITSNIPIKIINRKEIDGEALFGLLQNYLDSLNNDENPVIFFALENILLAKAKSLSEKSFEQFRTELNSRMEGKYPMNFQDIYTIFFELQDKEVESLCLSLKDMLNAKQTGEVLTKYFERMRTELDTVLEQNKEFYDDWYDDNYKDIEKTLVNTPLVKLDDAKINMMTYADQFQACMNKFLDIPNNESVKNLLAVINKIFSDYVNTKLKAYGDKINDLYAAYSKESSTTIESLNSTVKRLTEQINQDKKILEEKIKERNEINRSYLELEKKFDKTSRETKANEKEFTNNLNIETQKFQKMEMYYDNLIKDKENTISSLEAKINKVNKDNQEELNDQNNKIKELNRENVKLHVEIERLKNIEKKGGSNGFDNNSSNLQQLFKGIQNTFLDFKESIDKLDKENEYVYKTKYLELSSKEIENKFLGWIEDIRRYKDDQIKSLSEIFECNMKKVKEENEELNFELTKKNIALTEKEQEKENMTFQLNDFKTQIDEKIQLNGQKELIISTLEKNYKSLEIKMKEYEQIKENLEVSLNNYIVDYKMKEDELDTVITVIKAMFSKKKDVYEHHLSKLSNETKKVMDEIKKDYKLWK